MGGTQSILSFTLVFGRARRAALHGDEGSFLAAKPGSSQQGFGIEGGHTVRPGDKQQLRVLVGKHQGDGDGRGEEQLPSVTPRARTVSWNHD